MFQRLPETTSHRADINFTFEGRPLAASQGDSLACALLAAGVVACRTTPATGAARAPYCLMGVCFECLVTIDGIANRQACMVEVTDGMQVTRQTGKREASPSGPRA